MRFFFTFRPARQRLAMAGAAVALIVSGCENSKTNSLTNAVPVSNTVYLPHAQPRLQTMKLWIGTNAILAELAMSQSEVATGMMYRREMGEDEGMLFVFAQPYRTSFYMRNTYIPLSCAYIDPEGIIREIHDMKPLDETPVEAASDNIQFVLEMKQGWFDRHQVVVGAAVASDGGTLAKTFFNH